MDQLLPLVNTMKTGLLPHLKNLKIAYTPDKIIRTFELFAHYLNIFKQAFDEYSSPVIIWERVGIIHYCNKAYKNLTGFSNALPTQLDQYSIYKQFSPTTLVNMMNFLVSAFVDGSTSYVLVPMELSIQDFYVDISLAVTIKRDEFGLPIMLVGTVTPAIVGFPIMENQLQNLLKRSGRPQRPNFQPSHPTSNLFMM